MEIKIDSGYIVEDPADLRRVMLIVYNAEEDSVRVFRRIEVKREDYLSLWDEVERLAGQSSTPCCECGGPVVEYTVSNDVWDVIVRGGGAETDREYLCIDCFLRIALELPKSPRQRKGKNDETG